MKEAVSSFDNDSSTITLYHFFEDTSVAKDIDSWASSSTACFRSLLGQLIAKVPGKPWTHAKTCTDALTGEWDVDSRTDKELREDITNVILNSKPTRGAESFRLRIFIDALNECSGPQVGKSDDGFRLILRFASELLDKALGAGVDIGICVSRRYFPDYGASEFETKTIELDEPERGLVERFIAQRLELLKNPELEFKLLQRLIHRSGDGFQWANLVTTDILDAGERLSPKELIDLIDAVPATFGEMYEQTISRIDFTKEHHTLQLFQLVLGSYKPMTPNQLRHALAFAKEFTYDSIAHWENSDDKLPEGAKFKTRLHHHSHGLINIVKLRKPITVSGSSPLKQQQYETEEQVRFIHDSVGPFFQERGLGPGFMNLKESCHLFLFECCTRALDACSLNKVESKFLDYASEFWLKHAREADGLLVDKKSLPLFMQNCKSRKAKALIDQQVKYLAASQAKEAILLQGQGTTMLVLLATMGCTALLRSHIQNCVDCKSACASYNTKADHYGTALSNALIMRWTDTASYLIREHCQDDINRRSDVGRTPLYTACYFKHEEIVEFLLARGADASLHSSSPYEYPLHAAIAKGYTKLIAMLLRTRDAKTEELLRLRKRYPGNRSRKSQGWTALHFAVASEQFPAVKKKVLNTILEFAPRGVGLLDMKDNDGNTPLELAVLVGEENDEDVDDLLDMLEGFERKRRRLSFKN